MSPPPTPAVLEAQLVARLRANQVAIPTYPAVAAKLQALVAQRRATDELAAVAANDPALVAVLLARASSAASASAALDRGAAPSLAGAIQRIGVDELVRLALTASVGAAATMPGPLAGLRRDVWRCALVSARLCHDLAARRGIAAGEAYLAGLLHDFGAIAVLAAAEELGKEVPLPTFPEPVWRALVSRLHLMFGNAIALRWKLPAGIAGVIASYGQPPTAPRPPLVQLVQLVDRVIALLDAAPGGGTALSDLAELSADERRAIDAALPEVVAQMALYAPKPVKASESRVAPSRLDEESWPIAFEVAIGGAQFQARSISPSTFELAGPTQLVPNWLVDAALACTPEAIQLLVNIKSCEPEGGQYVAVAQPFALAGAVKQQWRALIDNARVALVDVA